jgi:hypothetical protein
MHQTRRSFVAAAALAPFALPQAEFGPHRIGRLIVGGNPVSGGSHVSPQLDQEMADYFSAANVKKLLRDCEQAGVTVWQSRGDRHIMRLLREYRNEGGRLDWIAQTASEFADFAGNVRNIAASKPIGIYLHGALTDRLWNAGKFNEVQDRLKSIRDAGVRTGLATHIPEVIDEVESRGWDADFYMTCLYNISRPRVAGKEHFLEQDRPRMLERVRRTRRQCLIFKVYGATRRCRSEQDMRSALREAFAAAKPDDCVIIGMFPKHSDQVAQNARLVREVLAVT